MKLINALYLLIYKNIMDKETYQVALTLKDYKKYD